MPTEPREATPANSRWMLIRDLSVLQFKLLLDGFRDLLLVPVSFIAAIASLLTAADGKPGPQFQNLLELGRRSDAWIDLFGSHAQPADDPEQHEPSAKVGVDRIVERMESFVVEEYQRGGLTRQAKEQIDKALDLLHKKKSADPDPVEATPGSANRASNDQAG